MSATVWACVCVTMCTYVCACIYVCVPDLGCSVETKPGSLVLASMQCREGYLHKTC